MPFPANTEQTEAAAVAEYEQVVKELARAERNADTTMKENNGFQAEVAKLTTVHNTWKTRLETLSKTIWQRDASWTIAQNKAAQTICNLEHTIESRDAEIAQLRAKLAKACSACVNPGTEPTKTTGLTLCFPGLLQSIHLLQW